MLKTFTGEKTAFVIDGPGKTGYPGGKDRCAQNTFHTHIKFSKSR